MGGRGLASAGLNTAMRAAALLVLCAAAAARAEPTPVDPWTDPAWQDVLYGLSRGQVLRVSASQQLLDPLSPAGGVISTRDVELDFDVADGRTTRLLLKEERRGESRSQRSLHYVYEAGRLVRIDEDGQATPALVRRYDAAGRLLEQAERTGAVIARTTWRHDAAGRPLERVFNSGSGSRQRETWTYRRDGTLERRHIESGTLFGKTIEFDAQQRPVRIRFSDVLDRNETTITYPTPTEAVHATAGFALSRDGAGRYEYVTTYRVRDARELQGVEAPELPTMRRQVRDKRFSEAQTEYDAAGRIVSERDVDASGQAACRGLITYHPSGPPLATRQERLRPDAACASSGQLDNDVRTDERGQWVEQRMTMQRPDGLRVPMSVQTRRIEYRR